MRSLFIVSVLVLIVAAIFARIFRMGFLAYHTVRPLSVYEKKYSGQAEQGLSFSVTGSMQTEYKLEGFVVLRNVLPTAWVSHLSNVSKIIEEERTKNYRRPTFEGATNVMYSNWMENNAVQQFWFESGIAEVVASVVGAKAMRLFEDLVIVANAVDDWYECWHADRYSFENVVEAEFTYSVWLPLVDITKETGGSLQICNRSTFSQLPESCNLGTPTSPLLACVFGQPDRDSCEKVMRNVCDVPEFRAGDAVIFRKDTVHRTQEILEPSFRRHAFIGRFVDGRATYKPKPATHLNSHIWKVQHDMCNHGLQFGKAFKGPCFPRIYPEVNTEEATSERQYMQPSLVAAFAMYEKFMKMNDE